MLQDRHPAHHTEEGQQGEDEEVFHGRGIVFRLVGILALGKDNWFVGIAEGLRDHRHNHSYLHTRAIDTQLHVGLSLIRIDQGEDNLVGHLIQDARNTQNKDRPGIGQHLLEQFAIELPLDAEQSWDEEEGDESCTQQVDEEDIEY